ncbi:MAG: DUF4349 domain-containing protein [Nanoarchaeota archaeon]|nr:DUF4349 domain-containing protein [Nanoarchaeota archaeon]MBU4451297.1 DUF4349 domain-containing protein [Nanoarchaeota archaeon]MCG2723586.1 DUF4349 domain-containing protein [archaeon]
MLSEKTMAFLKANKLAAILGALLLIVIFLWFLSATSGSLTKSGTSMRSDGMSLGVSSSIAQESASYKNAAGGFGTNYQSNSAPSSSSGSYVEVKEGSMTIDTKNAESDSTAIRSLAESSGGYIEDTRKSDNDYSTNINLRARVPEAKFQSFVDSLKNRYDEKDFTVSFYRVSTQREIDELSIINTAYGNYAEIRNRTMQIKLDENQINLLFKITQNELELKRLERQYTSSLSDKQARSEYATITIALVEKKTVKIMPENIGNQLRMKAKNALSDISNSLMDIFTGSIAVFVSAVKYVIYIILFVIPVIFGYRILMGVYGKVSGKV